MAIFSSTSWTGREPGGAVVLERPPIKSAKLETIPVAPTKQQHLDEYAELAGLVGIIPPDLGIEAFKAFLTKSDIPTFSLTEVIKYMDAKAAKESKDKAGWEWRPLRDKDHRINTRFGRAAERDRDQFGSRSGEVVIAASDYYFGPREIDHPEQVQSGNAWISTGRMTKAMTASAQSRYDKTIPLHALRKVALIEKEFGDKVGLFVCDYALAPAIEYPDPFLMAVVANSKANIGTGRFVIDFWDEPGFGIEQMLK
jgi:hypothetical protein